jgi:TonB-dependent starch-binding outer membrane protein SusC
MKKNLNDHLLNRVRRHHTSKRIAIAVGLIITGLSLHGQTSFAGNRQTYTQTQQRQEVKITVRAKNEKLSGVLARIEKQMTYVFVYSDDDVNAEQRINLDVRNTALNEVLESLSRMAGINFEIINDKIILRGKSTDKSGAARSLTAIESNPSGTGPITFFRADVTITGRVTDENGAGINFVSVTVKGSSIGTTTNASGNFTVSIPDNVTDAVLVFSNIGYENQEVAVDGRKNFNIVLRKTETVL